jgi:hypothetical protein
VSTPPAAKLPPRGVDQRRSPRRRTLLAGKVVFGEGQSVSCTIRDISESGAKIRLAGGACIPSRVFLIERRTATAYEARVSWIKAPDFGLTFVTSYSLEPKLPAELRYLVGVWEKFRPPLAGV